jgi:transcriptional regulator with XRE-family HTH domain
MSPRRRVRTNRHRAERPGPAAALALGAALRQARTEAGLDPRALADRIGVPAELVVSTEQGRLADVDAAQLMRTVRRTAELLGADVDGMLRLALEALEETQREGGGLAPRGPGAEQHARSPRGATAPTPPVGPGTLMATSPRAAAISAFGATTGLLGEAAAVPSLLGAPTYAFVASRPSEPRSLAHLEAFQRTAQFPASGPGPRTQIQALPLPGSGLASLHPELLPRAVPAAGRRPVRRAPLVLRLVVWLVALALVVAAGALVVAHVHRAWLARLHLVATNGTSHAIPKPQALTQSTPHSTRSAAIETVTTATDAAGLLVTVRASTYAVRVAALAPVWVEATVPGSFSPEFAGVLQSGTRIFTPVDGRLALELGAARVLVAVLLHNRPVPGFLYEPSAVPVVLNFVGASRGH